MTPKHDTVKATSHVGHNGTNESSIIALDRFIQATRDSGYKGTASAVSELVDNSIQAGATEVAISIAHDATSGFQEIEVLVCDNGHGMRPSTLRQALRFGGSTRFNDRSGFGRYGMGLPNSSLSQARRVTVYTWQSPSYVYQSYLDVDEIASGELTEVPKPMRTPAPGQVSNSQSGTIVRWSKCDRLDNRRVSTICRKLSNALGRRFRHYIFNGLIVTVNGDAIHAIDPLYINEKAPITGASLFGEPFEVEVWPDPNDRSQGPGKVRIMFSELPVQQWHSLPNKDKRRMGIAKGAGVSIVRAGREVDYGWFFLGNKRRENYDDWWRCEIQFDPILDEAFGITHTKQQVRPAGHLLDALSPDIEAAARALNSRARKAHLAAKTALSYSSAESRAAKKEPTLSPLPPAEHRGDSALLKSIIKSHPHLRTQSDSKSTETETSFHIVDHPLPASIASDSFFTTVRSDGRLIMVLNSDHPFYKRVYRRMIESDSEEVKLIRSQIDLLLLAAARSEAASEAAPQREAIGCHREAWGRVLASYLND